MVLRAVKHESSIDNVNSQTWNTKGRYLHRNRLKAMKDAARVMKADKLIVHVQSTTVGILGDIRRNLEQR